MPGIDNRAVWDKGIGPAAETIFSSSAPATMSGTPTNYNTGAWSQDKTVQSPTTATTPTTPATPATPASPIQGSNQQQQKPKGPHPMVIQKKNALDQAQLEYNQAAQALQGKTGLYAKHNGMSLANWQRKLFEAQKQYQLVLQVYGG